MEEIGARKVERVSTVDARRRFSRLVNRVSYGHERILLTWRGFAVAAVIPLVDLARLERAEQSEGTGMPQW